MLVPETTLVIGNWKMNPATREEAVTLSKKTKPSTSTVSTVICPPDIYLEIVRDHKESRVLLGAQGFFAEQSGSMTGETALVQLQSLGVQYVILGHSSQRAVGESSEQVNTKIHLCLQHSIIPIVCIGETARDDAGAYLTDLRDQIQITFAGLTKPDFEHVIIAYEPVWAIGAQATRQATPAEFESSLIFIKKVINDMTNNIPVGRIIVVYGGSVNTAEEARSYVAVGGNGVLVGRASLDIETFNSMVTEFSK